MVRLRHDIGFPVIGEVAVTKHELAVSAQEADVIITEFAIDEDKVVVVEACKSDSATVVGEETVVENWFCHGLKAVGVDQKAGVRKIKECQIAVGGFGFEETIFFEDSHGGDVPSVEDDSPKIAIGNAIRMKERFPLRSVPDQPCGTAVAKDSHAFHASGLGQKKRLGNSIGSGREIEDAAVFQFVEGGLNGLRIIGLAVPDCSILSNVQPIGTRFPVENGQRGVHRE